MTQSTSPTENETLTDSTSSVDNVLRSSGASDRPIHFEFDPVLLLQTPHRCVSPTAWVGHIPFAFWLVRAARPRILVELGTHSGNSYCAFCQAVVESNLATACYAIDTWQGDEQAGHYDQQVLRELAEYHDRRYGAFSTLIQSTFDGALGSFSDNTIDILHIDGCHTYDAVKHDFEAWLPKLARSGVVLFHDTNVRQGSFGVWRLWDELRDRYPSFSFSHSHGLGVLAVGSEIPLGVAPLFKARGKQIDDIQNLFGLIGTRLRESTEARLLVEQSAHEIATARSEAASAIQGAAELKQRFQETTAVMQSLESIREVISSLAAREDNLYGQLATGSQIEALEAHVAGLQTEVAAACKQLIELPNEIAASDVIGHEQTRQITETREAVLSVRSSLDTLVTQLAEARSYTQAQAEEIRDAILAQQSEQHTWTAALAELPKVVNSARGAQVEDVATLLNAISAVRSEAAASYERLVADLQQSLQQARAEIDVLRERTKGLVLDTTIAWTRYSDLLGFVNRLASAGGCPDVTALSELIQEGRLEARSARVAVLKKQAASVRVESRSPPLTAEMPTVSPRAVTKRFLHLSLGSRFSAQPSITVVCAAEAAGIQFDDFLESLRSAAFEGGFEVFAQFPEDQNVPGAAVVDIAGGDLVAQVDQIVQNYAQGQFVVLASVTGKLNRQWITELRRVFDQNALAVAACGLVLSEPHRVGWSGAIRTGECDWHLANRDQTDTDYRVLSVDLLDGIVPGFVALAPDIFRELGGLSGGRSSLEAALLDFSVRVAEAGFEIYRAPGVQLTLSAAAYGASGALVQRFASAAASASPSMYRRRPRVLVVDALTPTPDKDAGSVDAFWGMRIFKSLGYEVTFLPMYNIEYAGHYTDTLRTLGINCPIAPQITTPLAFIETNGHEFDLVVIHRVTVAYLLIEHCRRCAPQARLVFHTQDLHFLREERHAAVLKTPEAYAQAQGTRKEELRCIGAADVTIVVSRFEYDLATELVPEANIRLVPIMHPAPGRLAPRRGRDGIIFVGGFGHAPNVDAVTFLLDEVWDRVRSQLPDLTLRIIGSNAPESVLARHDPSRGVEILGFVPDLAPYYMQAIANVAPVRFGAGIKGKVLAALGVGLPTVATSIAAEGMGLNHGSDVLLADDGPDIASAIVRLCQDEELWYQISDQGLLTCHAQFSVDAQVPRWRRILRSLSLPS